jgi:hypothetical protein
MLRPQIRQRLEKSIVIPYGIADPYSSNVKEMKSALLSKFILIQNKHKYNIKHEHFGEYDRRVINYLINR